MSIDSLLRQLKTISDLEGIRAQLDWDQETYLPEKATEIRASQLSTLSGIIHQHQSSDALGEALEQIDSSGLSDFHKLCFSEAKRDYQQAKLIPSELVKELSATCSRAHHAWVKARRTGSKKHYFKLLERLIELKTSEVSYRSPGKKVYDELLDDFERGLTEAEVTKQFDSLKDWLIPFVKRIEKSPKKPDRSILSRSYPISGQEKFGLHTVKAMGFDFKAGRADTAEHPFCGGVGPFDVRLTTRYHEDAVLSSYFSFVHEAGHGLYEQGLNPEHFGTPAGQAVSMAFHESQSRLWENFIARSRPFWTLMFPVFKDSFPEQAPGLEFESFFRAMNAVERSLIRVEADEVTYNLHVILRFELERDMFSGRLAISDLEDAWNDKMQRYLGLTPPSPSEGVLQDPHWAFAGFGYFPTYTYGNLYAAQIHKVLQSEFDLPDLLRTGNFGPIREWLRVKIHSQGKLHSPDTLIRSISGRGLEATDLIEYLESKFCMIYGISRS